MENNVINKIADIDHSKLVIKGANEHNLNNVNLEVPKYKLIIFTGVSGSGKSSLAMDTIYSEGQRRYVESLSSYARQFLGIMKKPEVEYIEGLSPAIAIDQKSVSHNPRSTVGTITEIYDYLRLLFAQIGHPHCPNCKREIAHLSTDQITKLIKDSAIENKRIPNRFIILAPLIKDRKGEYSKLFDDLVKQGFSRIRVDGKFKSLEDDISLIKTNKHTIDVVIDRLSLPSKLSEFDEHLNSRLTQSVETALHLGNGYAIVSKINDKSLEYPENPVDFEDSLYSEKFACPLCNISLPEIEPRLFSFNAPQGACKKCTGLGTQLTLNLDTLLAHDISIYEGAIIPWASLISKEGWNRSQIEAVAKKYDIDLTIPIKKIAKEKLDVLLYGKGDELFSIKHKGNTYDTKFEGVIKNLERRYHETTSEYIRQEIEKYMVKEPCPDCHGMRLNDNALNVTILGKTIFEVSDLAIDTCIKWMDSLNENTLSNTELQIASQILVEIKARLKFLVDVGLNYLTLSRAATTLSGGEAQRIRLASQIGAKLSGVLYVLDEPSIGLHAIDHEKLIKTLKELRDLGNTIIVVEHDEQTMLESDYIVDFGPGAGHNGGNITAVGTPEEIKNNPNSLTGQYLSGKKKISIIDYLTKEEIEKLRNKDSNKEKKKVISIHGCKSHNLKNIDVEFPLNNLIVVTGISGSGKSTLVNETLLREMRAAKGLKNEEHPGENSGIKGDEYIDKIISINQNPIGRTPKSNPATYTKVFDLIRELYAQTTAAKIRGYRAGRFSFNVKGGRCESCKGDGKLKIEMQFMPDVYVTCEVCGGKRYNHEALEIEYKGKNISDVLDMTVEEATTFFANHPQIYSKLQTLNDVGLNYIQLGQSAPTLSGGEAQRVKLAAELAKKQTGETLYIIDEPTTGLHFADIERLIAILKKLVLKGNTVIVIEHNLDVIKNADWIIDLGPDGGDKGGHVVFEGTLQDLLNHEKSYTAQALRKSIGLKLEK